MSDVLHRLYHVVEGRKAEPQEGSYTCYLFDKGLDKILKKVGEECAETIIAAKNGVKEDTVGEISDLIYHLTVMMVEQNIPLDDVLAELDRRSDHTFALKEGTLYPILHALERDGAVRGYQAEAPTGRVRKYYRITGKGLRALEAQKKEWRTFTAAVNAVLSGAAPAMA